MVAIFTPPRRMATGLAALFALALAGAPAVARSEPAVAQVAQGRLSGTTAAGISAFKGIPYAQPPVGDLRWRPPAPAKSWRGVRPATAYGPKCWQNPPSWEPKRPPEPMSEDCLTLQVWTPAKPVKGGAPVIFWIHGGGMTLGSGSEFDGAVLARNGVTVVAINYRLGRFGFFAHPALRGEAVDGAFANWGLMDQAAALRWVHDNIAALGGDPRRVTIAGESSGGQAVAQLMLQPRVRGLFSGAIIQSAGGRDPWHYLDREVEGTPSAADAAVNFAKAQGLADATAAQLRALPTATVLGAISMSNGEPQTYKGPIVDGGWVKSDFLAGFVRGDQAKVPLIIGITDAELSALPAPFMKALRGAIDQRLGAGRTAVGAVYGQDAASDENLVNDVSFAEPARRMARAHAASGAPTWLYEFGYVAEKERATAKGARHASDVAYVFGDLGPAGGAEADRAMAGTIGAYWSAFSRTGAPAPAGLPDWPRYDAATDLRMRFDADGARPGPARRAEALEAITRAFETSPAASQPQR